jgi:hypothetical protein
MTTFCIAFYESYLSTGREGGQGVDGFGGYVDGGAMDENI